MTTEREYREWQRRNSQRHNRRRGRRDSKPNYLRLIILFLIVAIAIITVDRLPSFVTEYSNSLESLTKEFVTKVDEPVIYNPTADINEKDYGNIDILGKTIQYSGFFSQV